MSLLRRCAACGKRLPLRDFLLTRSPQAPCVHCRPWSSTDRGTWKPQPPGQRQALKSARNALAEFDEPTTRALADRGIRIIDAVWLLDGQGAPSRRRYVVAVGDARLRLDHDGVVALVAR